MDCILIVEALAEDTADWGMSNWHNSRRSSAGGNGKKGEFEAIKKEADNEFLGQSEVIKGDDRY